MLMHQINPSMKSQLIVFYAFPALVCCANETENSLQERQPGNAQSVKILVNEKGSTIETRFNSPPGFERIPAVKNSFAEYLRRLPLKPSGSKVKYYNGGIKEEPVYAAVADMDIGKKDLQQCADAVMRLRGEYFFSQQEFDKISFTLTNGFKVSYTEWIKGNRLMVQGNKTYWRKTAAPSNTYQDFRNYMDVVFTYAGSLSLSKSMQQKNIAEVSAGDVFILGGSPGHAVIVVDVAVNKTGKRVFMLAQSYMPAQDIQVLKNLNDEELSPWYSAGISGYFDTPEWSFGVHQLKTW
jgi:hypothetical protein